MPFELGRPLGVPNDAAFQKRVLMAALALWWIFTRPVVPGPVLEDYPEEAGSTVTSLDEDGMTGMVCPIALPKPADETAPGTGTTQALMREIDSLAPWYDLAVRTRGRTTVGPSGLSIDAAALYFFGVS